MDWNTIGTVTLILVAVAMTVAAIAAILAAVQVAKLHAIMKVVNQTQASTADSVETFLEQLNGER